MRFIKLVFLILVFGSIAVGPKAQEVGTLTTPVSLGSVTTYEITSISLARTPIWTLAICYQDNFLRQTCDYHSGIVAVVGVTGADVLVKQLNTANLSVQSLERRALLHLVSEGKIPAATVTGAPQ